MKKYLLIGVGMGVGIVITLSVIFFVNRYAGFLDYRIPFFSVPSDHVRIDLINETNDDIVSVSFTDWNFFVGRIKSGERKMVVFPHSGEGTCSFKVKFESGKELISSEHYIEGGYFLTEHIYSSNTETDF